MRVIQKLKLLIFLLVSFASTALYANDVCSATSYDFKNIFPKEWINHHCKLKPCGQNTYQTMLNDFHNIFPMAYLMSFKPQKTQVETVSLNRLTQDRDVGKSKTSRSGTNEAINSHMQQLYQDMLNNTVPSITSTKIIEEESGKSDNFFCDMRLHNRQDLFNQTSGEGRGVVARTILYMIDQYQITTIPTFLPADFEILRSWDKKYPPAPSECNRNNFIKQKQGNPNKFVTMGCLAQSL